MIVYFTLIVLMQSCTFDHPCTSTRTRKGTEKLSDIAGQLQTEVSLQAFQKGRVLQYNIAFEIVHYTSNHISTCWK